MALSCNLGDFDAAVIGCRLDSRCLFMLGGKYGHAGRHDEQSEQQSGPVHRSSARHLNEKSDGRYQQSTATSTGWSTANMR